MGDCSRDAFGQSREPVPDEDGMTLSEKRAKQYEEANRSYVEMWRHYAPSYEHYRPHPRGSVPEGFYERNYVPDIGLDGYGEPGRTYYLRYDAARRAQMAEQDDIDDDDDFTIPEIIVSAICIGVFAVGAVTIGKAVVSLGSRLIKSL